MSTIDLNGRAVVVGAGLAGLSTALRLAEYEPVVVLTAAPLGEQAASAWAQGGVAAAVGADDAPALHCGDTLAAGDGLCSDEAVEAIVRAGPDAIETLMRLGARFDRRDDGALKLGLEAAHSRRRIVHAEGDGTGREILRAVIAAVRRQPRITVMEGVDVRRLRLSAHGAIAGLLAAGPDGAARTLLATRVVLATGGLGALYTHTTNPGLALGRGLAMAARVGAALADMEFVQFHPTALDVGLDPMPLVSEAVRGEGAILINDRGERFMADTPQAELAPRDVVARAVWAEIAAGRRVALDAREALGGRFAATFPQVAAACLAVGVDPSVTPIPIRPAAHYHMGGAAVDGRGRTTIEGLWACGEVACTGLHGANRLASNSLLEAAVCAAAVAQDLAGQTARHARPDMRAELLPPPPTAGPVRRILEAHAGVLRDCEGLTTAVEALTPVARGDGPGADPALVGLFIATAALARTESRGGHHRTDFPDRDAVAERRRHRLRDVIPAAAVADAA
jgi:L-aspartate oxidase